MCNKEATGDKPSLEARGSGWTRNEVEPGEGRRRPVFFSRFLVSSGEDSPRLEFWRTDEDEGDKKKKQVGRSTDTHTRENKSVERYPR